MDWLKVEQLETKMELAWGSQLAHLLTDWLKAELLETKMELA